jgi:hypothetical protein
MALMHRPIPLVYRLVALLLLAAFLSGCASIDERKKADLLNRTTRQYERAIRWGDYGDASAFIKQTGTMAAAPNPDGLKQYRVTSYETQSTVLNEDDTEAQVVVQIKYYNENRMQVETLTDRQTWKYEADPGVWYLDSPLPAFH